MAKIIVLASGTGTNFEALADRFKDGRHEIALLICDRKNAPVLEKAAGRGIPALHVSYYKRPREDAEAEIMAKIDQIKPSLIVLAGFMRLFTANFTTCYSKKIINIHPSLLPRYPGTAGIKESYQSSDKELGISIHYVDEGMDTGPIIKQFSFTRRGDESLAQIEEKIHALEHKHYPAVIKELLDK